MNLKFRLDRIMRAGQSLQNLIKANLQGTLGIRFFASEYSTGTEHGRQVTSGKSNSLIDVFIGRGHDHVAGWGSLRNRP